jgi:glycosyltransferase involved in cell wall biosynthesis
MRILTISNYYPSHPGGIEIVAQNLVSRWRTKHEVHWAACEVASHPYAHDFGDIPLPATNFAEQRLGFPYPVPSVKSIFRIFQQVRWSEVVHIHDCLYFANLVAFLACRLYSKPLVVTQHVGQVPYQEIYKNTLQKAAYQTVGRMVLKSANEVVFISNNVKKWFEARMALTHVSLIQNGIDHRIFFPAKAGERRSIRTKLGLAENGTVLLFIGRFTRKKGLHLIHKIAAARPDHVWLLVGDGEIDTSVWNLPNVKVLPRQPQFALREFYVAADIFVLPSEGEGFPLAVQEALTCGLPAAVSEETASSLPDAPLISLDLDGISNLLGTLDSVLGHADCLRSLSKQSELYAETWDWDLVARRYEEHFGNLLNRQAL